MAEGKLADPIGLPLDRVDGQLKVTGRAPMPLNTPRKGVPLMALSCRQRWPRGASLPSTCATQNGLPECCWC